MAFTAEQVTQHGQGAVDSANTAKRIVDLEGRMTTAEGDPSRFSVHADAQASVPLAAFTLVDTTHWGGADYAVGATFDGTTFTIQKAGMWMLAGGWAWASNASTGACGVRIYVNGSYVCGELLQTVANETAQHAISTLHYLNVNDTVQMYVAQNRGSGQQNSTLYALQYLKGVRVGA